MAFDGFYLGFNKKRIKGIVDFYGHQFFFQKKIADLGCGYADIGGIFHRLGSEITAIDARQEHLNIAAKKYPGIKTLKADLDRGSPFGGKKFDLILDLDIINHLIDYEAHLKYVCAACDHLVIEAAVCDSSDPNKVVKLTANKKIYDLSVNGVSTFPTAAAIERVIIDSGMNFKRLDRAKFNSSAYTYDWQDRNSDISSLNNRRIWFAVKNDNPKQFGVASPAPSATIISIPNDIRYGPGIRPSPNFMQPVTTNNTNVVGELGNIDLNKTSSTFLELGKCGRLGNQFFQMAALIGYACKYDTNIKVKWHCHYTNKSISQFLKNQIWQDENLVGIEKTHNEPSFSYNEIPFNKNINLHGFFQSEKYFENNKELVRQAFEPSDELLNKLLSKYGSILGTNTCAVHIRRGDYVNNRSYYNCEIDYYIRATSTINSTEKIDHFMIFSDDINWCKQNLRGNYTFVEGNSDIEDLYLMSLNKHNIMSNSSFSWWASWLNKNENKKIIVPKQWFSVSSGISEKDIYTQEMIKI